MTMGTEIQAYWLILDMISMNCMAMSCLSFNVFVIYMYLSWILDVVNMYIFSGVKSSKVSAYNTNDVFNQIRTSHIVSFRMHRKLLNFSCC